VKPAPFGYLVAASVEEAVSLLATHGDDAKILAGGQSLVPLLNMRLARPAVVIDVSRIAELGRAGAGPGGSTRYGAGVVHADLEDGRVPDPVHGLLRTAAAGIGYRAIRNRGTLGGSLAHADPAAEWPVVMAAVGATVRARSARGERALPARGFVRGFLTTALEPDELITAVDVPPVPAGTRWGLYKACRKPGEFSESLAAVVVQCDPDGRVTWASAWLGAARGTPVRLAALESYLAGRRPGDVAAPDVSSLVTGELDPARTDPDRYRRHLHTVSVSRALRVALPEVS
jgi:aerobic carbon-monoxide dehydrogenase medium subunit